MKIKKILAGVLAGAMVLGTMSVAAMASETVAVDANGNFKLTCDTTGIFETGEDEYARGYFQTYGEAPTVTKVTIVYDGAEVDVTANAIIDGSDGNYSLYLTDEADKDGNVTVKGYFDDASTLDKVTAISYYVTLGNASVVTGDDGVEAYEVWSGGAIGTNSKAGWGAAGGQWTTAVEDKEYVLSVPAAAADDSAADDGAAADDDAAADDSAADDAADSTTGDASFLWIALAALAATVAGTTVVLSKKSAEEM